MIIGAILDVSNSMNGPTSDTQNGAALIHFYTNEEAVDWARIQSSPVFSGPALSGSYCLCTVINTETGLKRWWYGGVEYTT